VASSTISLLSVDVEFSAPPELRKIVTGPVSAVVVACDGGVGVVELDPVAGGVTGSDGAGGAGSADPPEGGAAAGGPDDDSVDEPVELMSSASATPGVLATTADTPSAAASTPMRPIYLAYPIAHS